ncbi:MAG: hypothetical protein BroJett033_3820 [Chloroflexota bacterium]|nr:MAG: hypothetical protein BroJett033_3820 [Chloroflexota bacterium]
MVTDRPSLAIIGAGRVGTALATGLRAAGYRVAGVYSRTPASADTLARYVGAAACASAAEAALAADLILLTVPDDAISAAAAALAGADLRGKGVLHASGGLDAGPLAALAAAGALVGSLHPAFPFATRAADVPLAGVTFAVEAEDARLRGWLLAMVAALGGRALLIPPGGKAVYHAALVLVSNYTVTLYALGMRLLAGLGADPAAAAQALDALLAGTTANLRALGVPDALTGPLVRADQGTIAAHLEALARTDPEAAQAYRLLGRLTLPLAQARGVDTAPVAALLAEEG